ncbi:MAG: hypothetical protein ORN98_04830, partial [Alphaproteobacteria bacterium]|nr:hypothetical protein [Alphaproteobacteria bacterium]
MTLDLTIAKIKASWLKNSWDFLRSIYEIFQARFLNRKYLWVFSALLSLVFSSLLSTGLIVGNDIDKDTNGIIEFLLFSSLPSTELIVGNDISNDIYEIIDYLSNHFMLSFLLCLLPSMQICRMAVHFGKKFNALTLKREKRATALIFSALISIVFVSIFISLMFALLNTPPLQKFI